MWKICIILLSFVCLLACEQKSEHMPNDISEDTPIVSLTVSSPSPGIYKFHPRKGSLEEILTYIDQKYSDRPHKLKVVLQYKANKTEAWEIEKSFKASGIDASISINPHSFILYSTFKHTDSTGVGDCKRLNVTEVDIKSFLTAAVWIKDGDFSKKTEQNNCAMIGKINFMDDVRSFTLLPSGQIRLPSLSGYFECLDCLPG